MVNPKDIRVLHLEMTTACNAACPQCSRENIQLYDKNNELHELSYLTCKKLFSEPFINQLDKLLLCGNFGDPLAAKDIMKVCKYFKSVNPHIVIGINTNGSLRNVQWWKELGELFNNIKDYCVFSIDGLQDTNHIYRIGTNFNKIIKNAKAFIAAGGSAHWDMLIFAHNEHQVKDARKLAKQLGFKWFRTKVSKRFNSIPVEFLNPPSNNTTTILDKPLYIDCNAIKEKSIYVAANGEFFPCCWIGNKAYRKDEELEYFLSDGFKNISKSWESTPYNVCSNICGVSNNTTSFMNQWVTNEKLI